MTSGEKFQEIEEYLTRCVVDTASRSFRIYSSLGNEKTVNCKHVEEFLSVLATVRDLIDPDEIVYAELPILQK